MAAPLDYNAVVEEIATSGDEIPEAGGELTFNFRCDPNQAWDPTQTFFAMDIEVDNLGIGFTGSTPYTAISGFTNQNRYIPGPQDFRAFFPLRAFTSMSHMVDGVVIASTNKPHEEKIMQERYLVDAPPGDDETLESMQTAKYIDDLNSEHNLFLFDSSDTESNPHHGILRHLYVRESTVRFRNASDYGLQSNFVARHGKRVRTVLFQPPFDFWKNAAPVHGGNHFITLNLRAASSARSESNTQLWGAYMSTQEKLTLPTTLQDVQNQGNAVGLHRKLSVVEDVPTQVSRPSVSEQHELYALRVDIKRVRLMRRVVRMPIERPLGVVRTACTQMLVQHGEASTTGTVENFTLPSSTFALTFYWKDASSEFSEPFAVYPKTVLRRESAVGTNLAVQYQPYLASRMLLSEFYFTFNGMRYPMQNIPHIMGSAEGMPYGFEKLHALSQQLQGSYNGKGSASCMNFSGIGAIKRVDGHEFFFPVASQSQQENNVLQTRWELTEDGNPRSLNFSLVVVAFYDGAVDMHYDGMNRLEKVVKTEWK